MDIEDIIGVEIADNEEESLKKFQEQAIVKYLTKAMAH